MKELNIKKNKTEEDYRLTRLRLKELLEELELEYEGKEITQTIFLKLNIDENSSLGSMGFTINK